MKKASGGMKLSLAVYREMEVFTQFSSDLDESTKAQLQFGQGLMRMLRQRQYHPYSQTEQVILLTAAMHHVMQPVAIDKIDEFCNGLLEYAPEAMPEVIAEIESTGKLSDEHQEIIITEAKKFRDKMFPSEG